MRRIHSIDDQMRDVVTYELEDGRRVRFSGKDVRLYGVRALMRDAGLGGHPPTRLPVVWHGEEVGTLPSDFDPDFARSKTFLYDPRPGDFRLESDRWIAAATLGSGDLDAVPEFVRSTPRSVHG